MAEGKWIAGLTPEMQVSVAAKEVLATRLKVVEQYLSLAVERASEDVEHVHQLRVATRRAGAALRVFEDCLPRKHLRTARRSLRRIRQAAGDARDWDVFLQGLPSVKPLTVAAARPTLDFLVGYGMGQRAAAQIRLNEAAGKPARDFDQECKQLPELAHEARGDNPPENFFALATAHLAQLVEAFSTAVDANPTAPAELHQIRILAKRVRYALEIFADCLPKNLTERLYGSVEAVQEVLGEVQDATVGLSRLTALRDSVKRTMPEEWSRLQKGFDGVLQSLRLKVPRARKAFLKWRKEWTELMADVRLEPGKVNYTERGPVSEAASQAVERTKG